jgi:hypothetical protein
MALLMGSLDGTSVQSFYDPWVKASFPLIFLLGLTVLLGPNLS